jgi:CheY-like chemotaxis protein
MSRAIELIEALTPLAWPLMLGFVLWKLFPALKAIVSSRGFSVKIAGMEVSVQDATEQFRTQIEDLQKQVMLLRSGKQLNALDAETSETPASSTATKAPSILWVDDNPTNNALEMAQLRDRGIDVVQAASTDEAMAILNSNLGFDAIISDMGRREQGGYRSQAGLVLLKAIRRAGYNIPFLVYSSQKYAARNDEEVKSAGGNGATASPVELLEWIDRKLKRQ